MVFKLGYFLFVIQICLLNVTFCANILAIFPFTARSHYIMFETLLLKLHKRGHNVTVLSHFPQKKKIANFTDINLAGVTLSQDNNLSLELNDRTPYSLSQNLKKLYNEIDDYEPIFGIAGVQRLINSTNDRFDLIITEVFNTDIFLGFIHKFKSPSISISACPLMPWAYERFQNPDNPSFIPVVFSSYHDSMSFIQRIMNFLYLNLSKLVYHYILNVKSQYIASKYFPNLPSLTEIAKNTSLILVNSHFGLHKPAPLSPRVIHVGGLHIKEPPKPLDQKLETFINESKNGVILLSMGSMFRSESIPTHVKLSLEKAFLRLPQTVIWKWENASFHIESDKILYMNWLPQRDVLAHKNIKLFIYHGGLMGTMEAVYCGVPILGIPIYGDMAVNLAAVTSFGAGYILTIPEITEKSVFSTINEMISNESFQRKAQELSKIFRDRKMPPLEEAVYWTEYVIRHNGAKHLRSSAANLYWFQYYLIDVILVLIAIVLLPFIAIFILIQLYTKIFRRSTHTDLKIKTM